MKARPAVLPIIEKFDKNGTGVLEKQELKSLLIELNEGKPVGDDEVEWVLEQASLMQDGVITRMEYERAIRFWHAHVEDSRSRSCVLL